MLKNFVPLKFLQKIRRLDNKILGLDRSYKHLSTEKVFETIYKNGTWGIDCHGISTSGSGSHTDLLVLPYVNA